MSHRPEPGLRKMKRHISEAILSYPEPEMSYGPDSIEGLFNWASNAYDQLKGEFEDSRSIMEHKLWRGVRLTSHYSGKGTAESCAAQIERVIRQDILSNGSALGRDLSALPPQQFQSIFTCDCSQ